ncbi:hypothetical protein J3A83DRAFT_4191344 [Scleroderma citrinum]
MRLGDHAASILVDGKVTVSPSAAQATCWVALEAGKNTMCSSPIVYGTKKRDIVFYNLELSDFTYLSCQEDEALLEVPVPQHFGEIPLKIEQVHPANVQQARGLHQILPLRGTRKLKKTLQSLCWAGFGPEKARHSTRRHDFNLTPNQDPPIPFVFKYRLTNGIAPQYSDIPLDIAVPKNDTSAVLGRITLSEAFKRLRDQVADPVQDIKLKRVKREHDMSEKCPPRSISGEVTDLT